MLLAELEKKPTYTKALTGSKKVKELVGSLYVVIFSVLAVNQNRYNIEKIEWQYIKWWLARLVTGSGNLELIISPQLKFCTHKIMLPLPFSPEKIFSNWLAVQYNSFQWEETAYEKALTGHRKVRELVRSQSPI